MKYELAKKLDKAGFKHSKFWAILSNDEVFQFGTLDLREEGDWVFMPSEDELISQLSQDLHFSLIKMIDVWQASSGKNALENTSADGGSQWEALVELWIKMETTK